MTILNVSDRIEGEYYGAFFKGVIYHREPNWEHGSRNAVNYFVKLDSPIKTPSGDMRDELFLQGVDKRGMRFNTNNYFPFRIHH